jgi:acylphosphatase
MTEELQRLQAFVRGRVQGVGFRYFVRTAAQSLGVVGWVRNLRDGRVELVAEGRLAQLQDLLKQVSKGPSASQVTDIEESWGTASGEFQDFGVKAST